MEINDFYKVLTNIIAAVESGGQIYGNKNYSAYAGAGANTSNEKTCTLGYGQFYGAEAHQLVQMIYDANASEFESIDEGGLVKRRLSSDWVAIKWNPTITEKAILIKLITTDTGKACQDKLMRERLEKYVSHANEYGVTSLQAKAMWAEIQHLGGLSAVKRIFARTNNINNIDDVMASLKKDQSDSSSSNQVGDKLFWSRHECCYKWIKQYLSDDSKEESSVGYDIQKLIDVATAEVGYCEKASNSNLDSKTGNAGSNNYTKYWRDMKPSYQGQAWCDCFVDWCFTKAYGSAVAQILECGGCGEFYTPTSAQYYKNKKQWYSTPAVGDQIFFKNSSRIHHTGIVVGVSSTTVTTIEGNTSNGSAVVANGGMVCKKSYSIGNSKIAGYGRPNYGTQTSNTGGKIMIEVSQVYKGCKDSSVVYTLRTLLRGRGMKGADGKLLELNFSCDDDCVHAINEYQSARRKAGTELGTSGKNDGCAGSKMWNDITGGLVR